MIRRQPRDVIVAAILILLACTQNPENQRQPGEKAGIPVENPRTTEPRTVRDSLLKGAIRVVSATLTPIDTTAGGIRARLAVRFDTDRPPGSTISIRPDRQDVTLRDDGTQGDSVAGDRTFSAIIEIRKEEIARDGQGVARFVAGARAVPQFHGRLRPPQPVLDRTALQDLRRASFRRPFPIDILGIVDPNLVPRSLMVTDPAVIKDPVRTFDVCTQTGATMGKWTFGHLMTEMANQSATSITPSNFVRAWLGQWETDQVVNTFTIPKRTLGIQTRIINPWPKVSGTSDLDLAQAPFRLLAIVNRVDLRQNLLYGSGSGGEGRFVFEAIDRTNGGCVKLRFTVIFEYAIPKSSCPDVRAWGEQWYALRSIAPTDPAYAPALEAITDQFVAAGSNPNQSPNKSAISQVRTNEIALGNPWELREFGLEASGNLVSTTTKREPDMSFHDTAALIAWINAHAASIIKGAHTIPVTLAGSAFLAARSFIPNNNTSFIWDNGVNIKRDTVREQFSLATCSGCHAGETLTNFTHVKPTSMTPPDPALSGFLTGISVPDPDATDTVTQIWKYADLDRRATDLDGLVNSACFRQIGFNNISMMTH